MAEEVDKFEDSTSEEADKLIPTDSAVSSAATGGDVASSSTATRAASGGNVALDFLQNHALPLARSLANKAIAYWREEGHLVLHQFMQWPMLIHVIISVALIYAVASLPIPSFLTLPWMVLALWLVWSRHVDRMKRIVRAVTRMELALTGILPEAESAFWLNKVVAQGWSIFINDFLSITVVPKLAPFFLTKYMPPVISKIDITSVDMGEVPPYVTRVRVLRKPSSDHHVELELDLDIVSGKAMRIDTSAYIAGMGSIPWAAQVTDLQLSGTVRAGIKFKRELPFVDRITVYFPKAPEVSCAIRVVGGFDAGSMPLVASYVDYTLQNALKSSLCWPNRLVVADLLRTGCHILGLPDIVSPDALQVKGMHKVPSELKEEKEAKISGKGGQGVHAVAMAHVEILDAESLVASDSGGTSDPFVKLRLGPARQTTSWKKATLNPVWKERFKMPIVTWTPGDECTLELKVRDFDRFSKHDHIGNADVDLSALRGKGRQELMLPLEGVKSGQLHIAVEIREVEGPVVIPNEDADPTEGTTPAGDAVSPPLGSAAQRPAEGSISLTVNVLEAKDLIAADITGKSDPYLKGSFSGVSFMTKVIKKTLNPVWNETFQLSALDSSNRDAPLLLKLEAWDRDYMKKDDPLGTASVNVRSLQAGKVNDLWVPLDGVASGKVHLAIRVKGLEPPPPPPSEGPAPPASSPAEVPLPASTLPPLSSQPSLPSSSSLPSLPPSSSTSTTVGEIKLLPGSVAKIGSRVETSSASPNPDRILRTGPSGLAAHQVVKLEVIEAADVVAADASGYSDPFMKISFGPNRFTTRTMKRTLNPQWHEEVKLSVLDWNEDGTVVNLQLYDKDGYTFNDSLGTVDINLNPYRDGLRHDLWFKVEGAKSGRVHVAVTVLSEDSWVKSEVFEVIPGCFVECFDV